MTEMNAEVSPEDIDLLKEVSALTNESSAARWGFDALCHLSQMYFHGAQWQTIDCNAHKVRRVNLSNNKVPTPMTNIFARYATHLAALMSRVEPTLRAFPASDGEDDVATAIVATKVLKGLDGEIDDVFIRNKVGSLVTLTGNAFRLDGVEDVSSSAGWRKDDKAKEIIGTLNDLQAGLETAPDPAQRLMIEDSIVRLTDILSSLSSEGENERKVRFVSSVYSPAQVFAAMNVERIEEQDLVVIVEMKSGEWIKREMGEDVADAAGSDSKSFIQSMIYHESIPYMNQLSGNNGMTGFGGVDASQMLGGKVYVFRAFRMPTKARPYGQDAIIINGRIVSNHPLPSNHFTGEPYIPISHSKYDSVPGAFMGTTPMWDQFSLQDSRNRWEGMHEMIGMRSSKGFWLMPDNVKMGKEEVEPGGQVKYGAIGGGGTGAPEWVQGRGPDASISNHMLQIDKTVAENLYLVDVLRGEQPYSGTPTSAIEILRQEAMTRHGPALRSISAANVRSAHFRLEDFRRHGTRACTYRVLDDQSRASVESFTNADLKGEVSIEIVNDSVIPKSTATQIAGLEFLVSTGFIDPRDRETSHKVQRLVGVTALSGPMTVQQQFASDENRAMRIGKKVLPVRMFVDLHEVHIRIHQEYAARPNTPPDEVARLQIHIEEHFKAKNEEQMRIQPPQMGPPDGAGGGEMEVPLDEGVPPQQEGLGGGEVGQP